MQKYQLNFIELERCMFTQMYNSKAKALREIHNWIVIRTVMNDLILTGLSYNEYKSKYGYKIDQFQNTKTDILLAKYHYNDDGYCNIDYELIKM